MEERKSNSGDWENLERSKRPMKKRRKNQEKKPTCPHLLYEEIVRHDMNCQRQSRRAPTQNREKNPTPKTGGGGEGNIAKKEETRTCARKPKGQ